MNSQTILTSVSVANQTAVPSQIRHLWGVKPGDKLLWSIDSEAKQVTLRLAPPSWGSYMKGLGKHTWKEDAQTYVKTFRTDRVR